MGLDHSGSQPFSYDLTNIIHNFVGMGDLVWRCLQCKSLTVWAYIYKLYKQVRPKAALASLRGAPRPAYGRPRCTTFSKHID